MKEFIDKAANNDYVLIGLIALLILLVIIFFIVLLFGGKKKDALETTESKPQEPELDSISIAEPSNIDFNHDDYVKETTAEFELTPLSDIEPTTEIELPALIEESPTRKVENIAPISSEMVNTFNFDELSKMISAELDKVNETNSQNVELPKEIKEEKIEFPYEHKSLYETLSQREETPSFSFEPIKEEVKEPVIEPEVKQIEEPIVPEVTFVDSFKEVKPEVKPLEAQQPRSISDDLRAKFNNNLSSVFLTKEPQKEESNSLGLELPKLAEEKAPEVETVNPVIKEDEVPLFERFKQETYDLEKKD